jgi:hypothetical protein
MRALRRLNYAKTTQDHEGQDLVKQQGSYLQRELKSREITKGKVKHQHWSLSWIFQAFKRFREQRKQQKWDERRFERVFKCRWCYATSQAKQLRRYS